MPMNQRIKQLIKSRGIMLEEEHFEIVELVVKECLEACSRASDIRQLVPPTREEVVASCINEIKRTVGS